MAPETREYHEFFRGIRRSGLRGAVAAVAILAIYFGVAAVMGGWVVPAIVAAGFPEARLPLSFLTIAAVLPFVFLVQRVCFGTSGRWLHSVAGRFRWAVAGRAALVVVPAFALLGAADWVLDGAAAPPATSLAMGAAILLALLIAPLQSMAEEYLFRGLLTRSVATWFGPSIVSLAMSLLVTAVLFAAFHGTADPWRLAFYLAFGVAASLITWRTGGVESASVMHAAKQPRRHRGHGVARRRPPRRRPRRRGLAAPAARHRGVRDRHRRDLDRLLARGRSAPSGRGG